MKSLENLMFLDNLTMLETNCGRNYNLDYYKIHELVTKSEKDNFVEDSF